MTDKKLLTNQEIFDKVAAHLLTQKKQSRGPYHGSPSGHYICLYRAPDGCQCAFGPFIPDDLYNESMEGVSAADLMGNYDFPGLDKEAHGPFVTILQQCHDAYAPVDWPKRLASIANHNNLVYPAILGEALDIFERA